jgi:hypothetical protein
MRVRERVREEAHIYMLSCCRIHALMLCVCPDHACLSLGQEACSGHKQGVILRPPGSPWSSRRRVCVVAQPDRRGQLGKANCRHVSLVGWRSGIGSER